MLLAVDAHGGDFGPAVTVPAALDALRAAPDIEIALVGLEQALGRESLKSGAGRLHIEPCKSVLDTDVRPVTALRQGADSSMGAAMALVADGRAEAAVSAGNTGALMALAVRLTGLLPDIRRPALMSAIPSATGSISLLDLGANLEADAKQLAQFAVMGAVAHDPGHPETPRVGLLNVGHEDSKGHSVVREAHQWLKNSRLNYTGFVEGHDIFAGKVDVAVCDGFSGNLLLKSSEGLARVLVSELRAALGTSLASRLGGVLAKPAMRKMLARWDPGKHNGAPLLGLKAVVVKSHGGADRAAMTQAILEAAREARRQVPGRIEQTMREFGAGVIQ